jgi:purine-nucleoside phosphorylase
MIEIMATSTSDNFLCAEQAAQFILERTSLRPRIGLVLGSGLGAVASGLRDAVRIPYEDIPYFPSGIAEGHAGVLALGKLDNTPLAVLQGRAHLYEGYSPSQIVLPVRALGRMGVRALVLTNAAGGIRTEYSRGALVVLRDHINLQGANPLIGLNDGRLGLRHPDMTDAYNAQFRQFAREESERLGGGIFEGVYAAVTGPNFETPAEIRFLRRRRRPSRHVNCLGGDCRAAHGHGSAGRLVRDQHGRRHDRREDHRRGSVANRRASGQQVSCAVAGGIAQDRRLLAEPCYYFRLTLSSQSVGTSALH